MNSVVHRSTRVDIIHSFTNESSSQINLLIIIFQRLSHKTYLDTPICCLKQTELHHLCLRTSFPPGSQQKSRKSHWHDNLLKSKCHKFGYFYIQIPTLIWHHISISGHQDVCFCEHWPRVLLNFKVYIPDIKFIKKKYNCGLFQAYDRRK